MTDRDSERETMPLGRLAGTSREFFGCMTAAEWWSLSHGTAAWRAWYSLTIERDQKRAREHAGKARRAFWYYMDAKASENAASEGNTGP